MCAYCAQGFTSTELRNLHEVRNHGEKTIPCDQCSSLFVTNYLLNLHKKRVHEKAVCRVCNQCGASFTTSTAYNTHMNRHKGITPYVCSVPECGKGCFSKQLLKHHMRSHTKPYECDECGKRMANNWLLQEHLARHRGDRPFKCRHPGCEKDYGDRRNAARHEKTCPFNQNPQHK
jgi:KRAB domain-containing zinc finger protein